MCIRDRIDTVLLCELAAHPDFVKLLADIQIYVEGIAATQIQNLIAWVDVARAEIMEQYTLGDVYKRQLFGGIALLAEQAHVHLRQSLIIQGELQISVRCV